MEIERENPTKAENFKNLDKKLYWIFGIMLAVIVIFLLNLTWTGSPGEFEYEGIKFQTQMLGKIPLYQLAYKTNKIAPVSGSAVVNTMSKTTVNILLRNDPRDIENIPVEGKIEYLPVNKKIYIVVSESSELLCDYSPIAMGQLSSFLGQNGFKMGVGISDEAKAEEQNMDYITCADYPNNMVLSFEAGDETKIIREGNCYTIIVTDCEILPAAERFIVQSLLDSRQ